MILKQIRKFLYVGSILLLGLLIVGCETAPSDFYIELSELNYGVDDYVFVEVVSNNQGSFPVRSAECYWTFDGSDPSENQNENTNYDWALGYQSEFTMKIPKDFYSGTIKFLCKITYSAMGKKNTVVKNIDKQVTYKYHSVSGATMDLYKNKGYHEENYIGYIPQPTTDSTTYVVKEPGDVKIKILMGEGKYSGTVTTIDNRTVVPDNNSEGENQVYYYKDMKVGDIIKIDYYDTTYIQSGGSGSVKSGEYLIILE